MKHAVNNRKLQNERDYTIDNLRALAIILVVFGHSIILYSSQWSLYVTSVEVPALELIKKIINIIQMPLYFFLSGFLFYFTEKKKNLREIVWEKIYRLLIPFVAFAFCWLLPIRYLLNYTGYQDVGFINVVFLKIILGFDNGHLWFLPTLFFCFIISAFCLKRLCKFTGEGVEYTLLVVIAIPIYFLSILVSLGGYLEFVGQYWVWFCLGTLFCYLKNTTSLLPVKKIRFKKIMFAILSVFFVFGALVIQNIILTNISSFFCVISLYFIVPDTKNQLFSLMSKDSFGIYLFHSPLIYITFQYFSNSSPFFVVGLNFIVWGGFSIVLTHLIRNSKLKWIIGE